MTYTSMLSMNRKKILFFFSSSNLFMFISNSSREKFPWPVLDSSQKITFIKLSTHHCWFSSNHFKLFGYWSWFSFSFSLCLYYLFPLIFTIRSKSLTSVPAFLFHLFCCLFAIFRADIFILFSGCVVSFILYQFFFFFNHLVSLVFYHFLHNWLGTRVFFYSSLLECFLRSFLLFQLTATLL